MSQQLGRMLTCDRCGETVFEPMREAKGDEGWKSNCIFFESTDGWVEPDNYDLRYSRKSITNGREVLCPECEATRKDIISKFWSNE